MRYLSYILLLVIINSNAHCINELHTLINESFEKFNQGEYEKSLEMITIVANDKEYKKMSQFFTFKANLQYILGDYEGATKSYEESNTIYPDYIDNYFYLYYCSDSLNIKLSIQNTINTISNWDVKSKYDIEKRIDFYMSINELKLAYTDLTEFHKLYKNEFPYNNLMVKYYFLNSKHEEALLLINDILNNSKYENEYYIKSSYTKACILYELGKVNKAYSLFKVLFETSEDSNNICVLFNNMEFVVRPFLNEEKEILKKLHNTFISNFIKQ